MSVEAMSWVLNHCAVAGTDKVIMIGIASHADADGRNAWPSISTLAKYAGVTDRGVQMGLRRLSAGGHIVVAEQAGGMRDTRSDRRPNRYTIVGMQPSRGEAQFTPSQAHGVKPSSPRDGSRGEAQRAHGVKPSSPEPSIEPSIESKPVDMSKVRDLAAARREQDDADFAAFWAVYPKHEGRKRARLAFAQLTKQDRADATVGAKAYGDLRAAAIRAGSDPKFTLHPATFITQRRWEDDSVQQALARQSKPTLSDRLGVRMQEGIW